MGFMDKAKKLAEQAQEKLDDAQKNFNEKQGSSGGDQPAQGTTRYDEHGRPIQEETPAAATPPPAADPAGGPAPTPEEQDPPPAAPPKPSTGTDTNASPDPFKPIQ